MALVRVDVISIGCLSRNLLWGEQEPLRTPHATTTLIRTGKRTILVDPALPAPIIAARLQERTGLKPDQIDTIFLTNFRPAHRAGVEAFPKAKVLINAAEKEFNMAQLERMLDAMGAESDEARLLQRELEILSNCEDAEDKIAPGVDLFPLPGFTPGTCGLLIALPASSILIAGDGVPTQEHFLAMQVLPNSYDVKQAGESMQEIYEIADLVVPGHDNLFINPRTQGM